MRVHLAAITSTEHSKSLSRTTSPEALTPATELVDLSVVLPLQVTVTVPAAVMVQGTVLALFSEKMSGLSEMLVVLTMVPVTSDVGHLVTLPATLVNEESPEVAETAPPTLVKVACAGIAATANAVSMAAVSSKPRRAFFVVIVLPFFPGYRVCGVFHIHKQPWVELGLMCWVWDSLPS